MWRRYDLWIPQIWFWWTVAWWKLQNSISRNAGHESTAAKVHLPKRRLRIYSCKTASPETQATNLHLQKRISRNAGYESTVAKAHLPKRRLRIYSCKSTSPDTQATNVQPHQVFCCVHIWPHKRSLGRQDVRKILRPCPGDLSSNNCHCMTLSTSFVSYLIKCSGAHIRQR
jgi:hypothetical protein